jgi:hypothetical protein
MSSESVFKASLSGGCHFAWQPPDSFFAFAGEAGLSISAGGQLSKLQTVQLSRFQDR